MKRLKWECIFSSMALSISLITALILSVPSVSAQNVIYGQDHIREIPNSIYSGTRISVKEYDPKLVGSNFLNEEWRPANIDLVGDTIRIEGVPVRMDLSNGVLEVKSFDDILVFPSYKIKYIEFPGWREVFTSRTNIDLYGPTGFYRVLYEGGTSLYSHYTVNLVEHNYNAALDAGQKDDRIVIEQTYYMAHNGELIELERKKARLIEQLGVSELESFIKENGINPKDESGLIAIARFLDGAQ